MALLGASAVATAGVQTTPAAAPFPGPLPGRPHTLSPLGLPWAPTPGSSFSR